MRRRTWPAVLAVSAVVVFASYLVFTQYLVRRIRKQTAIESRIFSIVQRGLLSADDNQAAGALLDIQPQLDSLEVPIVWVPESGPMTANENVPFDIDTSTPDGQRWLGSEAGRAWLTAYVERLERRRPSNRVEVPAGGKIVFGDPPIIDLLRWIPLLQLTGALVLVLVALAILRADARAERERLWSAMARELAHQMGTPLSSLEGWLEVLALPPAEREAFAEDDYIASVMSADVERLERVSRRFELIGKPPVLDTIHVGEIIDELHGYFAPRLPKFGRGITLRARTGAGLPAVRANRVLLAWAIENVVKNAVDALGGRGGHIAIIARSGDDGGIRVQIADDGPGIPAAVRDRIFEPGVTTKSGGWGVGLSLTRRIVEELHGGRIAVHGRKRGGTVFDISLPASEV